MDRQIRRLGVALMVCFAALFVQLNYIQVFRADELNDRPGNSRPIDATFSRERGTIASADGAVLARSVPSNDRFKFQRVYPEKSTCSATSPATSTTRSAPSGVELEYNDELAGRTTKQQIRSLGDLFVEKDRTGNLELTIRKDVQQVARDALGDRKGSVVALDVKTGGVLAMWSYPSYDPNVLSAHPDGAIRPSVAAKELLDADPDKPLLARSYREIFFPGSTFKVVTGSAGLVSGKVTTDTPSYPVVTSYTPPGTSRPIRNFGGAACGGTLFTILAKSCNSSFAQMGVDVGADGMISDRRGVRLQPGRRPSTSPVPSPPTSRVLPRPGQRQGRPRGAGAVVDRTARRAGQPAADGDGRRRHRQQGRDDGAPRGAGDPRRGGRAGVRAASPRSGRRWSTRPIARTMHDAMLGVVQNGSAKAPRHPRLRGRRQDRHRPARHRAAPVAHLDHRLRRTAR